MKPSTGRISAWDPQKGYGYLDADGQRVFLHVRDFAERHKTPEMGDIIVFTPGTDRQGRSCATQARHHNDGGRIRGGHLVGLALLLIAPTFAAWRMGGEKEFWFVVLWYVAASGITYFIYFSDKRRARSGAWREPEKFLHLSELAGGWPGAFLAQRRLRHKSSKISYQLVFWMIVGVHQFVALDYLLDWKMSRAIHAKIIHAIQ